MKLPVNYNLLSAKERREVREGYIRLQNFRCCHCGALLPGKPDSQVRRMPISIELFPKSFFIFPVHLHHNHKTGMTIGAVHSYCNAVLWQYHGE